MTGGINLRTPTNADMPFIRAVYFETQRWIIEELFGWRGEDVEHAKFSESYDAANTSVIVVDGEDAGWMTVQRDEHIELDSIYLKPSMQGRGLGTSLVQGLISEAETTGKPLRLSTAKINPARRLYERLGFVVAGESEFKIFMELRQTKPTINIERAASEDAVILRPYRRSDESTVRAAADDVLVARYMFAGFPHPYTAEDAAAWVSRASAEDPVENFVIEVGGMFAGAVGLSPRGMGYEGVGVIGYWLTPAYWGKGIATAAVDAIVNYAIENGFRRLVASVYAPNVGSARVLEKNGFVLEGRLREHRVGRDGVIMDELLFGRILRERILDDASTAGRSR